MDPQEIHYWFDQAESSDKKIREEAQGIIDKWEKDISPDQMWRMKEEDSAVCIILSVGKKIRARVNTYSPKKGEQKKVVYFGKKSFLTKWERMY